MISLHTAVLYALFSSVLVAAQDTIVDDATPSGSAAPAPPSPFVDSDFLYQHYVPKTGDPQQNGLYYRLYVPPGYATSGAALHPLVIFHHGDGQKELAYPPRNQKQLTDNGQFNLCSGTNQAVFPCFVAMVQAGWWGRDESAQMTAPGMIAALARRYRIDPNRVIVTGLSGGGGCTESWAGQRPDVYAGYVALSAPSPGNPGSYQPMNLATLPGWFFGSRGDGFDVNPSTVRDIRAFGGNPMLTVYNGGGHSRTTWNAAYSTPTLYRWMNALRRGQTPQMPVEVAFTAPAASGTHTTSATTVTPAGTTLDRQLTGASSNITAVTWYTADDAAGLDGETALGASTTTGTTTWTATAGRNLAAGDTYVVATAQGSSLHPTQAGMTVYSQVLNIHRSGAATAELDVTYNGAAIPDGYRQSVLNGGSAGVATLITFTLRNSGGSALSIPSTPAISYPTSPNCSATISTTPPSSIAAGSSATMVARVTPTVNGLWEFRVAIASTDSNENPYNLIISGNAGLPATVNVAPVPNAGADRTITLPATTSLSGSATDDGLPAASVITYAWTKLSGPGTVTFAAPTNPSTTATFGSAGTYVLQLTASDGALSASDSLTVTVNAAAINTAPVPNAGADQSITLPATASLSGSATDDGLPAASVITYAWTKLSGPGTVTFAAPTNPSTSATFGSAGTYVLQLTASDSDLSADDTVQVIVDEAATPGRTTTSRSGTASSSGCGAGALGCIIAAMGVSLHRRRRQNG
jgi:poly(3-hydroxybutyrate) depolymerase